MSSWNAVPVSKPREVELHGKYVGIPAKPILFYAQDTIIWNVLPKEFGIHNKTGNLTYISLHNS